MTWNLETSNGYESDKIRFEVLPYLARGGLDIGCGARKVWPHMVGIDSLKDTQLFGTPIKPDLVVGDAARLTLFADGAIDNVFSSHLLEHIEDWQGALREWWRVLKAGGHLVLYLPHKAFYPNIGTYGSNPDHKHDFMPSDIIDFMKLAVPDWTLMENQPRNERDEYSFLLVFRKEAAGQGQQDQSIKAGKTVGLVRVGAHGDALWASSPIALLKEQGYAVTAYVSTVGGEILRHDPNIDRLVVLPDGVMTDDELLEFWAREAAKHDKWVNLIGSVEQRLLYHPSSNEFYLPQALRHRFGNANYMEMVHDYSGLPYDFRQKFYPSEAETMAARKLLSLLPKGPTVVLNPTGSGPAKTWPHAQRFMQRMAEAGVNCVVLGDMRYELDEIEPHAVVVGREWPVRVALAFAMLADAVVATESLIANAVAMEPMLKVVMLSHSSNENLTKHWVNTAAIEATGVACHPCHRVHGAHLGFCSVDKNTGWSACMASAGPDMIADFVLERVVGKPVKFDLEAA